MTGDLIINGKDAFMTWGVRMGDGFLDAIDGFNEMKDYIENESRIEHGKRMITDNARVASREIALQFTIEGSSESDYRAKKKAFQAELEKGTVKINVPSLGKSLSYGMNLARCFGKVSSKFCEPNPTDRSE